MKKTLFTWMLSLALLAGGAVVTAWAQTSTDLSKMSLQEMVDAAGKMVADMEKKLTDSFKLLEEAIAEGDVATTNTRNEAITAMKGLVKLSEENFLTLQQKAAEGDRDRAEHEFVKISIAQAKIAELFAQVQTAGGIAVDLEAAGVEKAVSVDSALPVLPTISLSFIQPEIPATTQEPPLIVSQSTTE